MSFFHLESAVVDSCGDLSYRSFTCPLSTCPEIVAFWPLPCAVSLLLGSAVACCTLAMTISVVLSASSSIVRGVLEIGRVPGLPTLPS